MTDAQTTFRDVINRPHIHAKLRRDDAAFTTICAAMDFLSDADVAFGEFQVRIKPGERVQYIEIFGVYQAVQVTVDALRKLADCLNVSLPDRRAIDELAAERARIVGHPMKRNEDGVQYNSFIHRFKMSPSAVEVRHIGSKEGSSRTATYSPIDAISRTKELRDKALIELGRKVVAVDRAERMAKMSGTLASCFHSSTNWMLQHVSVAPYSDSERLGLLGTSVATLCMQLRAFIERAIALDLADVFPEIIRDAGITIEILERVLELAPLTGSEPSIEIIAFSESAVARVEEMVERAREIDEMLAEEVRVSA